MSYTKNPRNIEVKSLFSADEFLELQKECESADVKRSPLLRDLALNWVAQRKNIRQPPHKELPACGHGTAISHSGRSYGQFNYGAATHMRRRL